MPPYYTQQMASRNHLPLRVANTLEGDGNLDVTATRGEDGKTLVLHVVNTNGDAQLTSISLNGFEGCRPTAQVWTLTADLQAANPSTGPETIKPQEGLLQKAGAKFDYRFPPHSYTILRLTR